MPELPEVETTRRGLLPYLEGQRISQVILRRQSLRWPIPTAIGKLSDQPILDWQRRAKYLLLKLPKGYVITHLGMSGSMRVVLDADSPPRKHDHVDWCINSGARIRFHDPRRFGFMLWHPDHHPEQHALLAKLGPEPLGNDFSGEWLWRKARGRSVAIKSFLMNAQVVVGVGNIYAAESLYAASIHPLRAAGKVSLQRYELLAAAVIKILQNSIRQGGTTLRDFVNEQGEAGYFKQQLNVYDRAGENCVRCSSIILNKVIGQRSSYYCPGCQH